MVVEYLLDRVIQGHGAFDTLWHKICKLEIPRIAVKRLGGELNFRSCRGFCNSLYLVLSMYACLSFNPQKTCRAWTL